nr:hypothetical protein [uncultured Dongia sp.]
MTFGKSFLAAVFITGSLIGVSQMAFAADSCEMQTKALSPMIDALTDAATKEKASKLQEKAIDEATTEADEDECMDYLKDLKAVLGVK